MAIRRLGSQGKQQNADSAANDAKSVKQSEPKLQSSTSSQTSKFKKISPASSQSVTQPTATKSLAAGNTIQSKQEQDKNSLIMERIEAQSNESAYNMEQQQNTSGTTGGGYSLGYDLESIVNNSAAKSATLVEGGVASNTSSQMTQGLSDTYNAMTERQEQLDPATQVWDSLPAEVKQQIIQRSELARRLRELRNVDPCAEIAPVTPQQTGPSDNAPEVTRDEGGTEDYGESEQIPFLVPKNVIEGNVITADREVTLVNRHLFDDNQWIYNTITLRDQSLPEFTLAQETGDVLLSDTSRPDALRYTSGKFWSVSTISGEMKFINKSYSRRRIGYNLDAPYSFRQEPQSSNGSGILRSTDNYGLLEEYIPSENSWISTYVLEFEKNKKPTYFNLHKVYSYLLGPDAPPNNQILGAGDISKQEKDRLYSKSIISLDKFSLVDTVFSAEQPFFESELDKMSVPQFTSAKIEPVVTSRNEPDVLEPQLPNLYNAYYKVKNVNKLLEELYHRQINAGTTEEASRIAEEIESIVSDPNQLYTTINCNPGTNIYKFPCQQVIEMQEANNSSFRGYGNYVEITINTQQGSKISSMLHETGMDLHILELLTTEDTSMIRTVPYAESMSEAVLIPRDATAEQLLNSGFSENSVINNDELKRLQSDVNRVWNPYIEEYTTENLEPFFKETVRSRPVEYYSNEIDKREYPLSYDYADTPGIRKFLDTIKRSLFVGKLYNFLGQNNIRSFGDILEGKKCYSEIIGYHVYKHIMVGNQINPSPVQEFFFMDSDQIKEFKFIDTQVRTGTKYVYRVKSINFVIGSVTRTEIDGAVSNFITETNTTYEAALKSVTVPTLRVIEAPFFERIVSVVPKPPMAPEVSFLPYQGVDDKFQILLQSAFGEARLKPISVIQEDLGILENMVSAQVPDSEGKILYKNDSLPEYFQIFRLEEAPTSYADFGYSSFIKEIKTNAKSFLHLESNIQPNKDYYYMFREYDGDGISNPSSVYRIKMVSYMNGIYMDLEVYDMKSPVEDIAEITFGSSIQISPSSNHRTMKFPAGVEIDSRQFALTAPSGVALGNSQKSIWGRKFKARIISKSSGKKVDINFDFTTKSREDKGADLSQAESALQKPPICD